MKSKDKSQKVMKLSFVGIHDKKGGLPPMRLHGLTRLFSGTVTIENTSDESIRLKAIPIEGVELRRSDGSPLKEVRVFRRLKPGEQANIALNLDLDPQTPPGVHEGTLVLGEGRQKFSIRVIDTINIHVIPGKLLLVNKPGSSIDKIILVTNAGNVNLTLTKLPKVAIEDEFPYCGPIRAALREGAHQNALAVLDLFAQKMHEALSNAGTLITMLKDGKVDLAPGETQEVVIRIKLPETIDEERNYRARLPILNTAIAVIIQPM